jgi:hypothetical protein
LGVYSLSAITTGRYNTAVGSFAQEKTTSGQYNTSLGSLALRNNLTGAENTAIGYGSLNVYTGGFNTAVGNNTMAALTDSAANYNTCIGHEAMQSLVFGEKNTAIGAGSMGITTSNDGTCYENVAVGYLSLSKCRELGNTAVGAIAGTGITTGRYNSLLGTYAGTGITIGNENVCLGANAGLGISTGSQNIAIGSFSATKYSTGGGATLTTGTGNIMIGSYSRPLAAAGINQIVIGNDLVGQGNYTATIGLSSTYVWTSFSGANPATWARVSDISLKKNINKNDLGLNFIKKINPVTYNWIENNKLDKSNPHYREENEKDSTSLVLGLIAQNVKQAMDEEGADYFYGWCKENSGLQGISLEPFVLPLINAVKELSERLEKLESKIK